MRQDFGQRQQSFLQCLKDSTFSHPCASLQNKSYSVLKRIRRPSAVIPENIQPKKIHNHGNKHAIEIASQASRVTNI